MEASGARHRPVWLVRGVGVARQVSVLCGKRWERGEVRLPECIALRAL